MSVTAPSCETAQQWVSDDLDGEAGPAGPAVADHLATCADCQRFAMVSRRARRALRVEAVATAPDIAGGVTARLAGGPARSPQPADPYREPVARSVAIPPPTTRRRPSRRRVVAVVSTAAAFVAGVVVGAHLVAPGGTMAPASAGVPQRVRAAQLDVDSLSARVRVTERGWQPAVPERVFAGDLAFRGPDRLALTLDDATAYPTAAWVPNDARVVVRPGSWWARGPRPCPAPATPACASAPVETEAVEGLEPFDPTLPAPLDLVVPVSGFLRTVEPASLGTATVAGRPAVGVVTSAAQAGALLDGLRAVGNLRRFFPADRVELWLDGSALVPLLVRVIATDDPDRAVWAATEGSADRAGDEILRYELADVTVNGPVANERFPAPPAGTPARPAGFVPIVDERRAAAAVEPATPPPGLRPGPAGTAGASVVRTWVSGRGWVKVRVTEGWAGPGLAGLRSQPVRATPQADGTPAFVDDIAGAVAVHGDRIDVTVTGSLPVAELVAVASSLGVPGRPPPADWPQAAAATPADAARRLPGVVLPAGLDGSTDIAVGVDDHVVNAVAAGAGARAVVLSAAPGSRLGPPFDMAVVAVTVRGAPGRYSAARVELEWVEGGIVYRLRGTSLGRADLLAVATGLAPA
jgi:hypothetical protein